MRITRLAVFAIGLTLSLSSIAAAHHVFIMPEKFRVAPGEVINVGYHAADGFPDSTQLPKRLDSAAMHTPSTTTRLGDLGVDLLRRTATVTAPSGYFILTAVNPASVGEMSANSFLNYLKEESLTKIIEAREKSGQSAQPARERYSMFLKSIVLAGTPNDAYKHAVGTPIEIIPERDPAQVKAGESLPVRVLVKGKPMADLQIFAATTGAPAQNIGKTDANGRIAVTVKPGPWRLHTIHMERVHEERVDWESFWTTLTFEIR